MSTTEAPDMTAASSSPWRCCGRQRKTSLVETGDTKEEYDMSRTKKGGKGAQKKPVFADTDRGKCVCEGVCVWGDNLLRNWVSGSSGKWVKKSWTGMEQ